MVNAIRTNGDAAVREYSEKFDKWSPEHFKLSPADIDAAIAKCPQQTIDDIKEVQENVRLFAEAQRDSLRDFEIEIRPGVHLGQKNVPVNTVGAYVGDIPCYIIIFLLNTDGVMLIRRVDISPGDAIRSLHRHI